MGRRRKKKKVDMTRGLGSRYGATVRKRYVKVLSGMKKAHKCPRCGSEAIRRESVGVWNCRKCSLTFSGGAYTPITKLGVVAKRAVTGLPAPEVMIEEEK